MYVQAVALFLKSDEAFDYVSANIKELHEITGIDMQLVLPAEVEAGDAAGMAELFAIRTQRPRYPGLLRSDMPCFWVEDERGGHAIIRMPSGGDLIGRCIRAMTDAAQAGKDAAGIKSWVQNKLADDVAERDPTDRALTNVLRLMIQELGMGKPVERLLALFFGVVFIAAILALAVVFPQPSLFQYQVFRIVLALAAAGFVSMTPGFLQVTISNFLRAGGGLAVFAIVYFYNPASLVAMADHVNAAASVPAAQSPPNSVR
jgi:hypothetical protein